LIEDGQEHHAVFNNHVAEEPRIFRRSSQGMNALIADELIDSGYEFFMLL
jgi:hypothetical protein